MRRMARHARSTTRTVRVLILALAAAATYGSVTLLPAYVGAAATTRDQATVTTVKQAATASAGTAFGGTATVGALFALSGGQLGTHFCTASVVHSAHGDLVVTAAHCVTGVDGQMAFIPGYVNGSKPYGTWPVTAVYTDQAWQQSQSQDDDVAFLRLSSVGGKPVESVTGAEQLAFGAKVPALVQVVGYPDSADQPVSCVNWAKAFSPTQLVFDCDNYTDGTSGGPFILTSSAGHRTVIGVVGGYEQGGDTADMSYSPVLGATMAALYRSAEAAS